MNSGRYAFSTLVSVFFFWGFVAASNDILIPVFKNKLHLEQWQGQMVSVAFYVAYTVGSLIYLLFAEFFRKDLLMMIGYKNGIALGLCISALGTLLFYPAAELESFNIMIGGLFIVGLGFSLQQTAANPLAILLSDPSRASQRLSLAGGVNNVGTTIGPLVVSYAIFGVAASDRKLEDLSDLKFPYLIVGAAFLIVAVLLKLSRIPDRVDDQAAGSSTRDVRIPMRSYPQLWMGMIAIFLYVGVEVSTAANLPEFMRVHADIEVSQAAPYISLFWGSLMIGRWTSSAGAFESTNFMRKTLRIVMPYLAFGIFILVNYVGGADVSKFYLYALVLPALILADFFSKGNPARQLVIFSCCGIASLLIGLASNGMVAVFAFISVGLFCSTLWPCIFTLAIRGLGPYTNRGSGYLIMMIMGGGLVSWLQGWLAGPERLGIKISYLTGVICFVYLLFYGWRMSRVAIRHELHELHE